MDYRPDSPIWKSYVWHKNECFFVSTIERDYNGAPMGNVRGQETIVWKYDFAKSERGGMLGIFGSVQDHQQICRGLIADGASALDKIRD